jgi:Cys-rich protein (TIGR01571 family)
MSYDKASVSDQIDVVRWTFGLFDCFSDPKNCIIGWCCWTMSTSKTATHNSAYSEDCSFLLGFCAMLPPFCCVSNACIRNKIRKERGIEGACCSDCCIYMWCPCCARVQEVREVETPNTNLIGQRLQDRLKLEKSGRRIHASH